ncbi:hypothetical protein EV182_007222, partial [Spiromyces aspiralis]
MCTNAISCLFILYQMIGPWILMSVIIVIPIRHFLIKGCCPRETKLRKHRKKAEDNHKIIVTDIIQGHAVVRLFGWNMLYLNHLELLGREGYSLLKQNSIWDGMIALVQNLTRLASGTLIVLAHAYISGSPITTNLLFKVPPLLTSVEKGFWILCTDAMDSARELKQFKMLREYLFTCAVLERTPLKAQPSPSADLDDSMKITGDAEFVWKVYIPKAKEHLDAEQAEIYFNQESPAPFAKAFVDRLPQDTVAPGATPVLRQINVVFPK